MKLENQVTSLALSQRLKELGVKQESLFGHYRHSDHGKLVADIWHVDKKDGRYLLECSAFTVAELGEMLERRKEKYQTHSFVTIKDDWVCYIEFEDGRYHKEYAETEADARAKMLIYLLENKLITV